MASTKSYPPGGTFLDTLKKSFTDVPMNKEKDNAIATTEFLEAAESLTTLFGTYPLENPRTWTNNTRRSRLCSFHASQERHVRKRQEDPRQTISIPTRE